MTEEITAQLEAINDPIYDSVDVIWAEELPAGAQLEEAYVDDIPLHNGKSTTYYRLLCALAYFLIISPWQFPFTNGNLFWGSIACTMSIILTMEMRKLAL